jgi:hypothetical protein
MTVRFCWCLHVIGSDPFISRRHRDILMSEPDISQRFRNLPDLHLSAISLSFMRREWHTDLISRTYYLKDHSDIRYRATNSVLKSFRALLKCGIFNLKKTFNLLSDLDTFSDPPNEGREWIIWFRWYAEITFLICVVKIETSSSVSQREDVSMNFVLEKVRIIGNHPFWMITTCRRGGTPWCHPLRLRARSSKTIEFSR